MPGRRLMLFVVLLVVIGAVASATVPRERKAAVRPTTPPAPAPATPAADVVKATLPGRRDVRARVGDVVEVTVEHNAQDIVQVVALGIEEPVEPGIAAQLVFDADRAGRFAVTLRDAGRRIGTVDIREAG